MQKTNTENSKQIFPEKELRDHDRSAYYAAGNTVCGLILGIYNVNRSQTHECGNWDWGRAIPREGIHKWDFVAVHIMSKEC